MAEFMADDADWLRSVARSYPPSPQRARLAALADGIEAVLTEAAPATACKAALMLSGEHFPCDWPVDEDGRHDGWAHANKAASALWKGSE